MPSQFIATLNKKLSSLGSLDDGDRAIIEKVAVKGKLVRADTRLVSENETTEHCFIILHGYAYSSKTTRSGRRQIISFHIPGEIPDLQGFHLGTIDHDLTTLTGCTLGLITHSALRELLDRPNIALALWRETLQQASICREWVVNVGRREAIGRMAHLLLELQHRLNSAGRADKGSFAITITQAEWADCLGLSTVHVNRVLQQLRRERLISTEGNLFRLLNKRKLAEIGEFTPNYLMYLDRTDPSQARVDCRLMPCAREI